MKIINKDNWARKEIFDFFSGVSDPFYMVSFTLDVTELKAFTKRHGCSFYHSLIYLCTKAMESVENFMYACRGEDIWVLDERIPSFTDRKDGSELFQIINVPAAGDILSFCRDAAEAKQKQDFFIDMSAESDSMIYISCLPTVRLTAMTNEFDRLSPGFKNDSVPRISWGRYIENNGRLELTVSLEVNHRFIDGIHIEKFVSKLEALIKNLKE